MSFAIVRSRAAAGVNAPLVTIEVHLSLGIPGLAIVGLPAKAVKESKDRVRCALINSSFEFPAKRIIVNLAPADLPKEGGRFDLPIALGILAASNQIPRNSVDNFEFVGELALNGELRPVSGILPFVMASQEHHQHFIVPHDNAQEASLLENNIIFAAKHIKDVCAHLSQREIMQPFQRDQYVAVEKPTTYPDIADVVGQEHAKRALLLAAAGGHSALFIGPPGTGKTMLASRLPGLLPDMLQQESLEVASVYSISRQQFNVKHWRQRPFRAPHHTASSVALVGGGNPPRPGEISLAHQGVLFLDELPEFNRHSLEVLREPLEAGKVSISRACHQVQFPASFQLITAMNPCPCGYLGDPQGQCRCTGEQVQRYQSRISGPLLDRIDIQLTIPRLPPSILLQANTSQAQTSAQLREQVTAVHQLQINRCGKVNAKLTGEELWHYCALQDRDKKWFEQAIEKLGLSARAYHRVLKLARTIADLDAKQVITEQHLQEALSYRYLQIR